MLMCCKAPGATYNGTVAMPSVEVLDRDVEALEADGWERVEPVRPKKPKKTKPERKLEESEEA